MSEVVTVGKAARRRGRPPKCEGRDTREQLLEAALELFAREGYAAATVRQIAAVVGVRDSAIYAHFSGKQAMYDALLAEVGVVSFSALRLDVAAVVAAGPQQALPAVVSTLVTAWDTPRARRFASLILREGAGATGRPGLAAAVETARQRLEEPFRRWQAAGLLRADIDVEDLVWEFFTPLNTIRYLYLYAEATHADRAEAHRLAQRHTTFFLTCVTLTERR